MALFKVPFFSHLIKVDTKKMENTASFGESVSKPGPTARTPEKFENFLGNLSYHPSRFIATKTALSLWETAPVLNRYLNNIDNDFSFLQLAATQNNLHILTVNNDLDLVKKLNLPAILEFLPPGAFSPRYLTILKMTESEITFKGGEKEEVISVEPEEMESYWSGNAHILWKNFFNCRGTIPINNPKESVFTLKMLLRDIGFIQIKLDYIYDDSTREAVKKIQEKYGIEVDGIVGAKTKIVIYNEKKELRIPHIRSLNDPYGGKKEGIQED
jgi:peptidoglycan hydrolase-like protein with peptidoglycan-binding domain